MKAPYTSYRDENGRAVSLIELDCVQDVLTYGATSSAVNSGYAATLDADIRDVTSDASWYGEKFSDCAQVQKVISDGWPAGLRRMQENLRQFDDVAKPRGIRRARVWSDQGDSVEMPRVWAGRLDVAWQRCAKRTLRAPQTVTIAAHVSARAEVSADALFWRGAAVLKLSDLLTEAGYNVEIIAVRWAEYMRHKGQFLHMRVKVKDARMPLDTLALSGVIAFPGFYRYGLFRLSAAGPVECTGRGESTTMATSTHPYKARPGELADVESISDAASARRWIAEQLAKVEQ